MLNTADKGSRILARAPEGQQYSYKVIITNKAGSARDVMLFHHGRGSQEGIIGEAKS